jgi:hypothetical protein
LVRLYNVEWYQELKGVNPFGRIGENTRHTRNWKPISDLYLFIVIRKHTVSHEREPTYINWICTIKVSTTFVFYFPEDGHMVSRNVTEFIVCLH